MKIRWRLLLLLLPLPLLSMIALTRVRQNAANAPGILWPVPGFQLVDQNSTPFSSTQMNGRVWLASFVYTNCPDVCPLVTRRMAVLRDSLQQMNRQAEVGLLSISVDPLRDTPTVLHEYAAQFGARAPDWFFLTGPLDTVIPLITDGFRLTAMHPGRHDEHETEHRHDTDPAADYVVTHTDRIVLIDRAGQVRGTYESSDPNALARLHQDLGYVLKSRN